MVEAARVNGWVVVLTSDHGQVDEGGVGYFGGTSEDLTDVPMWVFKHNGGLNATDSASYPYTYGVVEGKEVGETGTARTSPYTHAWANACAHATARTRRRT